MASFWTYIHAEVKYHGSSYGIGFKYLARTSTEWCDIIANTPNTDRVRERIIMLRYPQLDEVMSSSASQGTGNENDYGSL